MPASETGTPPAAPSRLVGRLDRAFGVAAAGGTVGAELRGGLTTFATMAYIVVVNADMLSRAGIPFDSAVFATCASAAVGTFLMAWWANYPFAMAPGMGINAYFAFSVVPAVGAALGPGPPERAWQVALGLVGWSGGLFLLATWFEVRTKVMRGIPEALKLSMSAGIGLFIAFVGLQSAGVVVADPVTLVQLGDIGVPAFWVAGAGLLLTGGLVARQVTGALLWGVLSTAALAVAVGEAGLPAAWVALPAASGSLLQWDLRGALDPRFLDIVVALLFVDFFDTMGTLLGVAVQGKFLDEEGNLPRDGRAMSADATATVVGAALGTPPVTTYVESAAGIAAGARTGLANLVVVAGFLGAMFFAPALAAVPSFATAPALIVVGALMTAGLARIDWGDGCDSLAAFVTTLAIPLTFSISDGMALGVLTYVGAKGFAGKGREVSWIVWVLAAVFLLRYLFLPAD